MNRGTMWVLCLMGIMLSSFFLHASSDTSVVAVNVDSLFVPTAYKQALGYCQQLVADIDYWAHKSGGVGYQHEYAELLVGKLMYLKKLLALVSTDKKYVVDDDMEYVIQRIEYVEAAAFEFFADLEHVRKELLCELFTQVKTLCCQRHDYY